MNHWKERAGVLCLLLLVGVGYAEPLPLVPGKTQENKTAETAAATTQATTAQAVETKEETRQQTQEEKPETPSDAKGFGAFVEQLFNGKKEEAEAPKTLLAQEQLLAQIIYAAAADQPYAAKVAVGSVALNRVKHPAYPDTLAEVAYEPGAPFQRPLDKWDETSLKAARDALFHLDLSGGALSFTRQEGAPGALQLGGLFFTDS